MSESIHNFLLLSSVWGTFLTILTFAAGTWISKKTKFAICNPLLLSSVFVIILLQTFHIPYADYKSGSGIVNFLLFPATVSLAIP
ncbi:MAG: LrgB family protein, partial [Blautia sp.]|nr:LrgB family protein [Blautia sp.]